MALLLILTNAPLIGCGSRGSADGAGAQADSAQAGENDESVGADGAAEADSSQEDESKAKSRQRRERTTSVQVCKAIRADLVIPVIAEGTIRARHSAEIRTEIAGRITRIANGEGRYVRKGSLIAKLDDREHEVAAEEARAKYIEAIGLLAIEDESFEAPQRPAQLQAQIDELAALERKGVITRDERLVREIALDVQAVKEGHYRLEMVASRSGIAAARAALERAALSLERTEIRAPFSGVITGLVLSQGEHVSLGQVICNLVNNTDLEAEVGVLESDIGLVDAGRPALLAIPSLGDTLAATVDVISPHFDRESRTCEVLFRLKNTTGKIRPGMFVRAIIAGQTYTDRLLVPNEAILTRDGRPLLFTVEGDRAKWLYLKLGHNNDDLTEIAGVLQGGSLSVDDLVVVSDHLTLAHDAKVKVKKVLTIRDPWSTAD